MNKKQIIGLIIAAVLFIITGASSMLTNRLMDHVFQDTITQVLSNNYTFEPPAVDYVAVVDVTGVIQEQYETGLFETSPDYQHTTTLDYLDYLMEDLNNVGVLLYVDSPGGTVYESDELYQKLEEYKEVTGRPVWGYMAHYAASGGYYILAGADKIYANANTVTGSIGVIMSGYDLNGLYEKLGIRYVSIASGEYKDSSFMTDELIAIYQSQVDEAYENFVRIVADGRGLDPDTIRTLADGRTYTAAQALEHRLIDEISLYEDAKAEIAAETDGAVFYHLENNTSSNFASLFNFYKEAMPKSEAQILMELAEKTKGGLQYYANGLQ